MKKYKLSGDEFEMNLKEIQHIIYSNLKKQDTECELSRLCVFLAVAFVLILAVIRIFIIPEFI